MKNKLIFHFFIYLIMILLFNNFECFREDDSMNCYDNRDRVTSDGELLTDGSGQWYMNVANLKGGTLVADKNCHARMKLTFWFLDKELAKTDTKPPILIIFHGGDGFFDPGSVSYSSHMVYGSVFWIASCEQAARNASENPTNFVISVGWDPSSYTNKANVGLSGDIEYTVYKPE